MGINRRRLRLSTTRLVAITSLLFGSAVGLAATPAWATLSCGAKGNIWNGYIDDATNGGHGQVWGVSANLLVQASTLCSAPGNNEFVNEYVMVWSTTAGGGYNQVGYYKDTTNTGGLTYDWVESQPNQASGYSDVFFGHLSAGTNYVYQVNDVGNACTTPYPPYTPFNCLVDYINGNEATAPVWDAENVWGTSTNWRAELTEESWFKGANVPGSPSSPANIYNSKFVNSSWNWETYHCGMNGNANGTPTNGDPTHWGSAIQSGCANVSFYTSHPY